VEDLKMRCSPATVGTVKIGKTWASGKAAGVGGERFREWWEDVSEVPVDELVAEGDRGRAKSLVEIDGE
jgi:hypothetical protein